MISRQTSKNAAPLLFLAVAGTIASAASSLSCEGRGASGGTRDNADPAAQEGSALTATQGPEILASNGGSLDEFGTALAWDQGTLLVGAAGKAVTNLGTGAAFVFVQTDGGLAQQSELAATDIPSDGQFGWSVALVGDTALIGAPLVNAVYVFVRSGTTWSLQTKLVSSDVVSDDLFGNAVALSGSVALIGANGKAQGRGAAYVFVRSGTKWTQQAKLSAADAVNGEDFGVAVALNGTTALVAADNATIGNNTEQGAVYVFSQSGVSWSQVTKITASDGAAGDAFGTSVALTDSVALVGAPLKTVGSNTQQGAAYTFDVAAGWTQQAELVSSGAARDQFGFAVALDGATALVGANQANQSQGAAYLFVADDQGGWWPQTTLTASDPATGASFGGAIVVSGPLAVVGAFGETIGVNDYQGAAYPFELTGLLGAECATASDCATPYACNRGTCSTPCHACSDSDLASCAPLTGDACDDGACRGGVCQPWIDAGASDAGVVDAFTAATGDATTAGNGGDAMIESPLGDATIEAALAIAEDGSTSDGSFGEVDASHASLPFDATDIREASAVADSGGIGDSFAGLDATSAPDAMRSAFADASATDANEDTSVNEGGAPSTGPGAASTGPSAASTGPGAASDATSGCACATNLDGGTSSPTPLAWLVASLAVAVARRRRRA